MTTTELKERQDELTPWINRFFGELEKVAADRGHPDAPTREAGRWEGGKGAAEAVHRQDDLLHRLAAKHKPSKRYHNYIPRYSLHFGPIRERVRRVVEIGVQKPASLLMWEEYFPNAEIVGVDIDPACKQLAGGRKRVLIGDQKSEAFLNELVETTGGFDIVIDDGEHSETAILKSFAVLFPALEPHGIYAVEDIIQMPNVSAFFRQIERNVNHWPAGYPTIDWPYLVRFGADATWLDRNVTGVHFYRYLCLVDRGFNPEDNPYLHSERKPNWPGSHRV